MSPSEVTRHDADRGAATSYGTNPLPNSGGSISVCFAYANELVLQRACSNLEL